MVVIIDYGMGNIGSIANMIKKVGYHCSVSSNRNDIANADKLILPGVGSFDSGINNLKKNDLIEVLNDRVLDNKIPILGICLGMQLMAKSSEEGDLKGLSWVDAKVKKFVVNNLKVPHMGWNFIKHSKESKLFSEMTSHKRFYFVHSYHVNCENSNNVLTTSTYGYDFTSSFEKDNVIGVQFHPEKSHRFGMEVFSNFMRKF